MELLDQLSSQIVTTVASFAILLGSWIWYRKHKQTLLQRCNINTISSNWFTGSVADVFKNHIEFHSKCKERYGRLYGYYLGTRAQIATTDLELISTIQVKSFDKFHSRAWIQVKGDMYCDLNCSVLHESLSLNRWKQMRSVLSRSFSSVRMKESVDLINGALEATLEMLKRKQSDEDIDMYKVAEGLTMDVIGRSSCAVLISAQDNPDHPLLQRIRYLLKPPFTLEYLPFGLALLIPEAEFILHLIRKLEYMILRSLGRSQMNWFFNFMRTIVKQRMNSSDPQRKDLLQSMIDSIDDTSDGDSRFTVDETVANSTVFLAAGYDTTASLIGCMSHVLVVYPQVQEKMRQEIQQLMQDEGQIGYNVLQLPYLDAVVSECLRVFPPITNFVNRKAEDDFKYKDVLIPKGTCITFPIYQLHRDEEYWREPNTFDPERFMGERRGEIKSIAYQPFGAGPRVCIGMRLALLEAKMALARLIMKYRFTASGRSKRALDDLDIEVKQYTISPRGVFVKLIPLS